MSVFSKHYARLKTGMLTLAAFSLSLFFTGCKKENHNPEFKISVVASGLVNPTGLETDAAGNIWVSETGSGENDAKVVLITPNGRMYDAIVNLSSIYNENSQEVQGAAHLLLDGGTLYVLAGTYMYKANISGFKPGDAPINGSTLPFEDIGSFVLSYPFVNNAHDSHPYNLTKGPDGDIYIADAGANAIIHRRGVGNYTVLAEIPGFANPTSAGSQQVQAVPTGLLFDGQNFLVTTITGFPFPVGKAVVYKVSPAGNVSVYQQGFTALVDIAQGNMYGHLLLQIGRFGSTGFVPNSGALILANGSSTQVLNNSLNTPVALKQVNNYTWYITSMGDGTVLKASYN
jgi:hypothetical protein